MQQPVAIEEAPSSPAAAAVTRSLTQFLCELGAAMSAAGDATTFIRRAIERVGRAYGLEDLRVSAGTSLLLLSYHRGDAVFVDLTTTSAGELRLDQVSDIYQLAGEA